jgi:signal transduction histidine kinase
MTESAGLRRKLRSAFIQAGAISLAAVIGVLAASAVLKNVLIQRALHEEAAHYWERLERDPSAAAPDTNNMAGYLVPREQEESLPPALRGLGPGYHALPRAAGGSLVLVEENDGLHMVLVFKQEQVDTLAFWFGVVPLALVLVAVYLTAWLTYRNSRRMVSPVIWLANQVRHWDPHRPDASALRPENLPVDVEGETLTLASSLHDFADRIGQFVEREHNFTRDASHELRTPLTVIRVAGDMMAQDDTLSPMAQRSLKRIRAAGRDMEALIEAFLILAREGDTGLPDEDFSVAALAAEEIEKACALVAGKPVSLELRQEADPALHAPPRVFSVMLGNLLRKACNNTERGTVVVTVRADGVSVADTGVGMTREELERVFEPFYRAGDGRKDGQGIGLTIVRRLSARYGWPVRLESEPGRGTTATISFPSAG